MITLTKCRKATLAFVLGALALGIAVYLLLDKTNAPQQANAIPPQSTEPLFQTHLLDANGKPQPPTNWRGKTLVVNFWASWCQPCREEMPAFSRLQQKYAGNNVQFIGIAVDNARNVADFSKATPVNYPLLIAETEGSELMRQLGNTKLGLPYTIVINRHGKATFAHLGRLSEKQLDDLLAKEASAP